MLTPQVYNITHPLAALSTAINYEHKYSIPKYISRQKKITLLAMEHKLRIRLQKSKSEIDSFYKNKCLFEINVLKMSQV